jgi:UDP-N-acetylglucosamine/UDP-N-acetylgalactosamine diphosphorylase
MIEYSDLPESWAHEKDEQGNLTFWAGNPAIHLFDVAFLRRMTEEADRLPWHLARKKVPHLTESGDLAIPDKENALKFERFIFDVLPHAERWTILPTEREDEFAPVKNKEGVDSPDSAQALMVAQAARWLRSAGIEVSDGVKVEISPLYALADYELDEEADRLPPIRKDTYVKESRTK